MFDGGTRSRATRSVTCWRDQLHKDGTHSAVSSLPGSQYLRPHLVVLVCGVGAVPESEHWQQKCGPSNPMLRGLGPVSLWRIPVTVSQPRSVWKSAHGKSAGCQTAALDLSACIASTG
jgi:hypothetical protein